LFLLSRPESLSPSNSQFKVPKFKPRLETRD
jgi:hypothetical protein